MKKVDFLKWIISAMVFCISIVSGMIVYTWEPMQDIAVLKSTMVIHERMHEGITQRDTMPDTAICEHLVEGY